MADQEYSASPRRPLVILLGDITSNEVLPDNIKPLEAWAFYDVDVYALDYYRGSPASPAWGGSVQGVGTRINTLAEKHGSSVPVVIGMGGGAAVGLRALQLYVSPPCAFVGVNGVYNLNETDELSQSVQDAFNVFCSGSDEADRVIGAYTTQMSCEARENTVHSLFIASETTSDVNNQQSVRMDEDAIILEGKTESISLYDSSCFAHVIGFICDAHKYVLLASNRR